MGLLGRCCLSLRSSPYTGMKSTSELSTSSSTSIQYRTVSCMWCVCLLSGTYHVVCTASMSILAAPRVFCCLQKRYMRGANEVLSVRLCSSQRR